MKFIVFVVAFCLMICDQSLGMSFVNDPELKDNFKSQNYLLNYFQNNSKFFIIEPAMLRIRLPSEEWLNLKWRFKLSEFFYNENSLTVGMFYEDEMQTIASLEDLVSGMSFTQLFPLKSTIPFDNNNSNNDTSNIQKLTHLFLKSSKKFPKLWLHVVVFHRVKQFLWIGQIPDREIFYLTELNLHYGLNGESIYDNFNPQTINSIQYPDEIGHFLSQIPTSRYLHCPEERTDWLDRYNLSDTKFSMKIKRIETGIVILKSIMKELMMEFWMVCGTLLGWYRQCHITPYTDDSDFATWSRYLYSPEQSEHHPEVPLEYHEMPMSYHLLQATQKYGLQLDYRFGDPDLNLEYSFVYGNKREKFDLFFLYPNATHYRLPIHMSNFDSYAMLHYPPYQLCSGELLGHKLLTPCDPEQLIRIEYGLDWQIPKKQWFWYNSSLNADPPIPFVSKRNISQYRDFKWEDYHDDYFLNNNKF